MMCAVCDGIYYLYQHDWNECALWNPAINELKPLPEISHKPGLPSNNIDGPAERIGFGRDPLTEDYKVFVLKTYWNINDDAVSVFIYSLRTNSWRYCGDLTRAYDLDYNKCYMYLNGFYFWFGSYNHSTVEGIVSFDLATDEFKEMDVPDYTQPSSVCLSIYIIHNTALAFLCLHKTSKILIIWTFTQGSWTKTLTMDPLPHIWVPIDRWKDNFIMLQTKDGKLVLIDPDSKELKDLGFHRKIQCEGVFVYMESLVSIKDKSKSLMQLGKVEAASKQV